MTSNVNNKKSTSSYMMTFVKGVVSWKSKLQKFVALSSIEVEYIDITKAVKEHLWM
uniref:Retrovirus-related Pol polyprotein from transposon TNT 1-94 n=1 Tax=Cajanus cajan TaxID=3821 RepID=A0A151TAH2_CAJCA|nr:Retrovirus-related Pol polyprotein from transposon TNT 1-94 [Cajanus cajan]